MTATTHGMSEGEWENLALETLAELAWTIKEGTAIAPGTEEREKWSDLHIPSRMLAALRTFNPEVPGEYLQQALSEILTVASNDAITENHRMHEILIAGYRRISYVDNTGQEVTPTIRLLSSDPDLNDWLAVNQVTIVDGEHKRRFDIVLYCNGMPVSILELKKGGSQSADVAAAHAQLGTYLREFPMAFRFSVFNLISDGIIAKYGSAFTPLNHFAPWNVDDDGALVEPGALDDNDQSSTAIETALFGLYNQERFLQLTRSFTAFDEGSDGLLKRIAKPHQYFAVTKAVASTISAVQSNGKAGVVWHTQGSGKSMEMELYANRVMRDSQLLNPTIIVITDRKELDGQLFQSFNISLLLPEKPRQIRKRAELRDELTNRNSGGIYFTTLQKFGRSEIERETGAYHPLLSSRRNIIVIVDEAHRSHYSVEGYARHLKDALPHATLIAFTGTPISFQDRNTRAVFGDYIDIYDLSRAVEDGATVPVYFEPRLIKVALSEGLTEEQLDLAADDVTRDLDDAERTRIEQSVTAVNAVYGAPARLQALAADLVQHWELRRAAMLALVSPADAAADPADTSTQAPGKAMIVGGTREICARLYNEIVQLRPDWHSPELSKGKIKVVYSGDATDKPPVSDHVRRHSEENVIKERLRTAEDELELVIVKDMMLTGFDSPPLHTLYLDRPLQGALLMQTLARVNRTFRDKDAGLLVGYAPLADNLQKALSEYSKRDQENKPLGRQVSGAADLVKEILLKIRGLLVGFDWKARMTSGKDKTYAHTAAATVNYLRNPATPGNKVEEGETLHARYRRLSTQLSRAWALCTGSEVLATDRPEVRFYEEVRVYMAKFDAEDRGARGEPIPEEIRRLLASLVADSTVSGEVLDIYEAAGMPKPSLNDLTPEFMEQAQRAANPHLAIEALRKLINEEVGKVTRSNVVRQRLFSERVTELMLKYTNQQLTSAEVIAELVELAREAAAEGKRGEKFTPHLSDDELAFFDTVSLNDSATLLQGDDVLAQIARELVEIMRRDVKTDWTVREDVRAKLRISIKRLLVKYRYPPDKQPEATKRVMEQMEALAPKYAYSQN